jgi:hypothetical protein
MQLVTSQLVFAVEAGGCQFHLYKLVNKPVVVSSQCFGTTSLSFVINFCLIFIRVCSMELAPQTLTMVSNLISFCLAASNVPCSHFSLAYAQLLMFHTDFSLAYAVSAEL